MAGAAERKALKTQALLALEDSRRAMTGDMLRMRVFLHPGRFLQQSVQKHRVAYILGAGLAGFVAIRLLLIPRGKTTRNRLAGLLGAALWPALRGPALDMAGRYLKSYLPQFFPAPQPPEGTE